MPLAQAAPGGPGALFARRGAGAVPLAIDGEATPWLIPDSVAYGHFIRATASSASAVDLERRAVFLARAGLTTTERQVYVEALGTVGAELASVQQARQVAGPTAGTSVLQDLKVTEEQAVAAAETRLRTMLPPEAAAKLDAHINDYVKRRIRIYRGPME